MNLEHSPINSKYVLLDNAFYRSWDPYRPQVNNYIVMSLSKFHLVDMLEYYKIWSWLRNVRTVFLFTKLWIGVVEEFLSLGANSIPLNVLQNIFILNEETWKCQSFFQDLDFIIEIAILLCNYCFKVNNRH